jgi:hypothetical protein
MATSSQYSGYNNIIGADEVATDGGGPPGSPMTLAAQNTAYQGNQGTLNSIQQAAQQAATTAAGQPAPTIAGAQLGAAPTVSAAQAAAAQANGAPIAQNGAVAQNALLGQLGVEAAGGGPNLANLQMQQGLETAQNNAVGQAALLSGRNNTAVNLQALANTTNAQQAAANTAAQNRAAQQLAAQQQLATVGANVQGQNLNQAQVLNQAAQYNSSNQQAVNLANQAAANTAAANNQAAQAQFGLAQGNLTQGAQTANQGAALTQNQQNNAQQQAMLQLAGQTSQAAAANLQNQQTFNANNYNTIAAINQKVSEGNQTSNNQAIGAGAAAIGAVGAAALSDETEKKNKKKGDTSVEDLLKHISAHEYEYKSPKGQLAPPGKHVGIYAQDLEKTKAGKGMVSTGPDGKKVVNYGQSLGTIMAALAHLHKKVEALSQ